MTGADTNSQEFMTRSFAATSLPAEVRRVISLKKAEVYSRKFGRQIFLPNFLCIWIKSLILVIVTPKWFNFHLNNNDSRFWYSAVSVLEILGREALKLNQIWRERGPCTFTLIYRIIPIDRRADRPLANSPQG